jgi:hypothetical protein
MGVLGHLVFANLSGLESLLLLIKKLYLSFCLQKDGITKMRSSFDSGMSVVYLSADL